VCFITGVVPFSILVMEFLCIPMASASSAWVRCNRFLAHLNPTATMILHVASDKGTVKGKVKFNYT